MGCYPRDRFVDDCFFLDDWNIVDSLSIGHGYQKIYSCGHCSPSTHMDTSLSVVKTGVWQAISRLRSSFMEQSFSNGNAYVRHTFISESGRFRVPGAYFPILGLVRATDLVSNINWHA